MKALILAGGFGTRLKDITKELPKAMVPIAGKPFLQHQIRTLKTQGLTDILLAVHHRSDKIKTYFGNGKRHGVDITYVEEDIPLGTAGAIKNAQDYIGNERFLVFNGDTYTDIRLSDFLKFHEQMEKRHSMAVTQINSLEHQELVEIEGGLVVRLYQRGKSPERISSWINSGAYIFEPNIFDEIEAGKKVSLEQTIFPRLVEERKLAAYTFEGYFMDIGRPETYKQFKKDFAKGLTLKKTESIREAIRRMDKNEEGLVFVVDNADKLIGVVTPPFINRAFIEGDANLEDPVEKIMLKEGLAFAHEEDTPERIQEIMLPRTNRLPILDAQGRIVDLVYRQEILEVSEAPIFRARSPLRISFSGGGTDKEDYFNQFGTGLVISATIDKHCHASAKIRPDRLIRINPGQKNEEIIDPRNRVQKYNGSWDLAKAVLNVMRPNFGFDLYAYNDLPPGRGLGSSGSFAVMLTELIANMSGQFLTNDQITDLARKAEVEELKIGGGWQDQYAAKVGGFNYIEFFQDRIIPSTLMLSAEMISELEESLLLCYVGKNHDSGEIHKEQERTFAKQKDQVRSNLEQMKGIATRIRDVLVSKDTYRVREVGNLLHQAWVLKRDLAESITNPEINRLYEYGLAKGASGGKLLGAGNGGYILFFTQPEKRTILEESLSYSGNEVLRIKFERQPVGTQIWTVRS